MNESHSPFARIGLAFSIAILTTSAFSVAACKPKPPRAPTAATRPAPSVPSVTRSESPAAGTVAPAPVAPAPQTPAIDIAAATSEADPRVAHFAGFTAPKPATWQWYPPENTMRSANWVIPAPGGGDQAHLVVFAGIGGTAEANAERWAGQFRTPAGEPVEPKIERVTIAGYPAMRVELAGEYKRTMAGAHVPDQLLLAAIVDAPEGSIQIMLSGDTATVEAQRTAFHALLVGLEREAE